MRSSSSACNSSATNLSKLLQLRLSSKWGLLAVSWSRKAAMARFTTSMLQPTVTHLCILLHMRLACLRWPLPPATRRATVRASLLSWRSPNYWTPSRIAPLGGDNIGSTALASILDSAGASSSALAVSAAASQALHAALQIAAYGSLVPSTQAPPAATQSTLLPNPFKATSWEAPLTNTFSIGSKGGAAQPPGGFPGDPDDNPGIKKHVTRRFISSAQANSWSIAQPSSRPSTVFKGLWSARWNASSATRTSPSKTKLTNWKLILQSDKSPPPETFVGFMPMKIVPRHLNEIKLYLSMDNLAFREKLVEVFEEPDLATAYLNALAGLSQTRDEFIFDYIHRARLVLITAHPDLADASRKRNLITSFLLGL